jgi:hypothetical protein
MLSNPETSPFSFGDLAMVKSYGAGIFCITCGKEPYAADPARETFSLTRCGVDGYPSNSPDPGSWYCEEHLPTRSDPSAKLASRETPAQALADLENTLEIEVADLEGAIRDRENLVDAFADFRQRIERGFVALRKILTPPERPSPTPKNRPPKKIQAIECDGDGQVDWVSGIVVGD